MRIVIPKFVIRVIDWITMLLPPPKPIGVKLFGREITWLDLFVWGMGALIVAGYSWWYGHWLHAVMAGLCFVMAYILIEWVL